MRTIETLKASGLEDEAFEVLGLGEGQRDGVVARLVEAADDAHRAPRVECGTGDDLLEQVHRHRAAAAPREQDAAGSEQLHGEQVEVLVGA